MASNGLLEFLGNPSVLIRNVTDGIYDLFHLPYVGMRHGPSGFMSGISEGATSLLKHLSLGKSGTDDRRPAHTHTSFCHRNVDVADYIRE